MTIWAGAGISSGISDAAISCFYFIKNSGLGMSDTSNESWIGKYRDISWMMPACDLDSAIERLGIVIVKRETKEWRGFCPDHRFYVGRESSDPNWFLNTKTGQTACFTEPRGSNLLFTTARLLKGRRGGLCESDCAAAARFLLGRDVDEGELSLLRSRNRIREAFGQIKKGEAEKKWLDFVEDGIKNAYMSERAYRFFLSPPGKPPTNITRETVRRYGVFERTFGRYANCVIVPIKTKGVLEGFVGINILGKEEWVRRHPTERPEAYRKTLYPSSENGFFRDRCLFGYDDCETGASIILTEGVREKMKLIQEGFPNSCAILGSYLSDDQILLLAEKAPKKLVLMFDGDEAGKRIAESVRKKTADLFNVEDVVLPEGCDPKIFNRQEILEFSKGVLN